MLSKILVYWASLFAIVTCSLASKTEFSKKIDVKKEILPPCQACRTLVSAFIKGMTDTNKKHFGGGDTAWEEEKLGDYAKSEVRLIEIQENLCSDIHKGQQQCYKLAEDWENFIEEWWFREQQNNSDLFKWLCIEKVQYCCPDHHFGPECKPCLGYPNSICSNNGKCKGAGTRKGNGTCICNSGYAGRYCDECATLFYSSYKDDNKIVCSKCHDACRGSCISSGPQGCEHCNAGWTKNANYGCIDINECSVPGACQENKECINSEGSFTCIDGERKTSRGWTRILFYVGLSIPSYLLKKYTNNIVYSLLALSAAVYLSVTDSSLVMWLNQGYNIFQ